MVGTLGSPSSLIPTAGVSKESREHGLAFFKKHSFLSFSRPVLVGFVLACCGTPGHTLSREEAGLRGAEGACLSSTAD